MNIRKILYYAGALLILFVLLSIFGKLFFINLFGLKFGIILFLIFMLGIIFIFISIIEWNKIVKRKSKNYIDKDNNENHHCPPRDYPGLNSPWIKEENLGMKIHAEELRNFIILASPDETTFIGIEGEWGSGKTWLIKYVLESLEDNKWVKIEFNPWLHTTPDKLKIDLINTIADEYGKATGRPLSKWSSVYRNLISSISETQTNIPFLNWFLRLFSADLKSSVSAGKEFGEWIKEGGKRLIVYIQDIDRCEREMILSLLRLLRESELWKGVVVLIEYDPTELKSKIVDLHKYVDIHFKYIPSTEGKIELFIKGIEILLKNAEDLNDYERKMLEELKNILLNPQHYLIYINLINIIKTSTPRVIRKILINLPFIVKKTFSFSLNIYHFFIVKFYELSFPEVFEYFFRMLYYNDNLRNIIEVDIFFILIERISLNKTIRITKKGIKDVLDDRFEKLKSKLNNKLQNQWEKIREFFTNLGFFEEEVIKKEKNAFWSPYRIKYYLSPLSRISLIEEFEDLVQSFKNNEIEKIAEFITNKIRANEFENLIYTLKDKWNDFKKEVNIDEFQKIFIEVLNHKDFKIGNDEFFKLIEIFSWSIDSELPGRLLHQDIEKYFKKFNPLVAQINNLYWRSSIFYRVKEKLVLKLRDFKEQSKEWQESATKAYEEQFNKLLKDIEEKKIILPEKNADLIESIILLCDGSGYLLEKEKVVENWKKIIENLKKSEKEAYRKKGEELEEIINNWEDVKKEDKFFIFPLRYERLNEIFESLKAELTKAKPID